MKAKPPICRLSCEFRRAKLIVGEFDLIIRNQNAIRILLNQSQSAVANNTQMKHLHLLLLALVLLVHAQAQTEKVLLASNASNASNTHVLYPFDSVTAPVPYLNTNFPNFVGFGAQWVWRNISTVPPVGEIVLVQSVFNSQCGSATLTIAVDDQFTASVNYGPNISGKQWDKIFKFTLTNLDKGKNILQIKGTNGGGYAGFVFAITQQCQASHMLRKHE